MKPAFVFQVPELTRAVRVNAQGMVTLPLLGQVRAGGLTANELETVLVPSCLKTCCATRK